MAPRDLNDEPGNTHRTERHGGLDHSVRPGRGGRIILVTDPKGAREAAINSVVTLTLPEMPATVTPLVYAVPVQLIAYHTAVVMGTDVDQPRNLAKSVTVE